MSYFVYFTETGLICSEFELEAEADNLITANDVGVMSKIAAPSDSNTVNYVRYLNSNFIAETQADIDAENMINFRVERNKRLADTDWTQTSDSPLSETEKQNYRTLRQNLRDMPQQDGFDPLNPVWPTLP